MTESEQFFGWALNELNKVLWAALATDKPKVWDAAEEIERIIIKALRVSAFGGRADIVTDRQNVR